MSESQPPRRGRFPLPLSATTPVVRRLVATGQAVQQSVPPRPLRPVSEIVRETARPAILAGHGLDSDGFRARMIERLRADGCRDEHVLRAMSRVPRHLFVDSALAAQAYEDTSLPIGHGQTISKPSVVARMLGLLRQRPGGSQLGRVLEIGTGCGYQAAVLCRLASQVYSIERLKALHDRARENLAPMRRDQLRLIYGDGLHGHGPNAPFDAIIAAAGGHAIPQAWLDQLAVCGRLVAPMHDAQRGTQVLVVVDRMPDGSLVQHRHETVRFVPLESGTSDYKPA